MSTLTQPNDPNLTRRLNTVQAFSLVVGTVIGTGVFLKAATMSQLVGSSTMVIAAWLTAGVLSLVGAFCYAEIGSRFPSAGGEYVYLKEAYGNLPAFLFGWMRFWIASLGSIAAYGVGAATFVKPFAFADSQILAIGFISLFTILNCFSVSFSGTIQTFITSLKIVILIAIALALFFRTNESHFLKNFDSASGFVWNGWSSFGLAMLAALWAYDGWNNMPMASGEIKNPQIAIPRSLVFGMVAVAGLYILVNLSYFVALPFSEVTSAFSKSTPNALPIATKATVSILGDTASKILSIAFVISALGAMNGSILTGARVPYAMAKDGLFIKLFAKTTTEQHCPLFAVIIQGIVSILLALSGTFDQLTDYVVFASWIFYGAVAGSIFIFRKSHDSNPNLFKLKRTFYPLLPIAFIIMSSLLLLNTLINSPRESGIGLLLILSGIPAFYVFKRN